MTWFGWLTKTKMETTGLDDLVGAIELLFALAIGAIIYFFMLYILRKKDQ